MKTVFPAWIKVKPYDKRAYLKTKNIIDKHNLNTVCMEANCPNRYECFSNGTATFMILGDTCTRNCLYCGIKKGRPGKVGEDEPERVAQAIKDLYLRYAVITCVTRDDLEDGGAGHFARTVNAVKELNPECKIELLISDLKGNWNALRKIINSGPDVLNHNIETVGSLFHELRPKGDYSLSLELLKKAKEIDTKIITKSGFMLGLGENEGHIMQTIMDLKEAGCDIITIGQYLQPGPGHFEVRRYYSPAEFNEIKMKAEKMGVRCVVAGPLVRSSYKAGLWHGKIESYGKNHAVPFSLGGRPCFRLHPEYGCRPQRNSKH